jgi:two-component system LytT family sensor kinase
VKLTTGARVTAGVLLFWVVAGMLMGAQGALGATLQGRPPASIVELMRASVVQMLPWIPVTVVAIAMAARVPLARSTWSTALPVHLVLAAMLSFMANVLVVLTFWMQSGRFAGLTALAREGAKWGAINFHVSLLVYAAVVGVASYVRETRGRRARELQLSRVEEQLTRARLEALNAQIRPHFLFNTMHTIGQLWRSGRPDDADAMLDRLGSLFHRVLSSTSRLEIPLEEELELVQEYFAIEEARFRDRLTTRIDVPDAARRCLVPPLILQPIVENAVKHGVSAMAAGGIVTVSARVTDGRLMMTITDDGPGTDAPTTHRGTGTGLRNTRERIARMYGDAGVMRMEHPSAGGTRVSIELPASA